MALDSLPDIPQVVYGGQDGLNRAKHILYWKRCLRTFLPTLYTSTDSQRLMLAYFTLAALDLLNSLDSDTTQEERDHWIEWVYSCQTPGGGFRGSSSANLNEHRNEENRHWDPPNVPATYFALSSLLLLGDNLERVDRKACLNFLTKMQRPDGSFGETLGYDDRIEGGMDTRFGYTAVGTRWILRGRAEGTVNGIPDIDVDSFVRSLRSSEAYDGGISELACHEAHGGYTFCAIAALYFIDRLPAGIYPSVSELGRHDRLTGLSNLDLTIHWLLSRQTTTIEEEEDEIIGVSTGEIPAPLPGLSLHSNGPAETEANSEPRGIQPSDIHWVGFNGRCNKIADTCYSWWVAGSLDVCFLR